MEHKTNPNDPANAKTVVYGEKSVTEGGLTKREHFAAQLAAGMMANADGINRVWAAARKINETPELAGEAVEMHIAAVAVSVADRLIDALNEKPMIQIFTHGSEDKEKDQ